MKQHLTNDSRSGVPSMDISLRQLQMLREVAARGTMAAAADALGYTPSAVSQQIAALEKRRRASTSSRRPAATFA